MTFFVVVEDVEDTLESGILVFVTVLHKTYITFAILTLVMKETHILMGQKYFL